MEAEALETGQKRTPSLTGDVQCDDIIISWMKWSRGECLSVTALRHSGWGAVLFRSVQ
jgi:hypothetical protein